MIEQHSTTLGGQFAREESAKSENSEKGNEFEGNHH